LPVLSITSGIGKEKGKYGNSRGPNVVGLAEVDEKYFSYLSKFCWHMTGSYPGTSLKVNGKRKQVYLHHIVFRLKEERDLLPGMEVDHVDRNPFNATEANLREVTPSFQRMNQGKRKDNTSGFRGVYWNKHFQKWECKVNINKKTRCLGNLPPTEQGWREAAHRVYTLFLQEFPTVSPPNQDWATRPYIHQD
jgi:hypothetical protein